MSDNKIKTANLLVELFVEELPPRALKKLGESFAATLAESLATQGLADANAGVVNFATPRRLGVRVEGVLARAADKPVSTKLMPVRVGLDADGKATPALLKRLAVLGTDASMVSLLRRAPDGKNEALFYDSVVPGVTLTEGLQLALETAMSKLPIPKVMTYPNPSGDGWETVNSVRPAHGLIALHGADIVPISVLGLHGGRDTQGHRFEARVSPVSIISADSYAQQLKDQGAVIASFAERRAEIVRQLHAAADPLGLKPVDDEALLDEVTALVERPNVLVGQFEEAYLEVPPECLILTMKANQKYFPLLDIAGKLTNQFLIVSNISPADPSAVIQGNERVVRPRLADAKFFFDQDRKKTLESRVSGLAKVVYHNRIGTQGERVERVISIARAVGQQVGDETLALKAAHTALLSKADLLTDMVGEFPELQGIMGRYYAQHDGLGDDIAFAIEDHYKPRFAGDELPRNDVGMCMALADKVETLLGLFQIGERPTGDKDPYALRRHALGIIRMFLERDILLRLNDFIDLAALAYANASELPEFGIFLREDAKRRGEKSFGHATAQRNISNETKLLAIEFILERLSGLMKERGFTANEVEAVFSISPEMMMEVPHRLDAVRAFAKLPESMSLVSANKRVSNILKKVEGGVPVDINVTLFKEAAETALFSALSEITPKADTAFESGDYTESLQMLAALKAPVDAFFDSVMVNVDDPALRANRLALLNKLHQTMNRVADISRLAA